MLAPHVTLERLDASLRVMLRGEAAPPDDGGVLSTSERTAIFDFQRAVPAVIGSALVGLESQLYQLRRFGSAYRRDGGGTPEAALEGVAVSRDGGTLLNELRVDILLERAIRRLRDASQTSVPPMVVVVRADLLKRRHLAKFDDLCEVTGLVSLPVRHLP